MKKWRIETECYPLQYSCLKSFMDRGAWQAAVHAVTESDTTEQLTWQTTGRIMSSVSFNLTMAKLLEISKNKGPCDPRLHCSTKLENFSFSLRSFFLLVHKVSSSIFPYMDLNLAFTSFFFFFHGKARERKFWYWLTLFARVFSNLKMKISLKQFNPTEIIWRKKLYAKTIQ